MEPSPGIDLREGGRRMARERPLSCRVPFAPTTNRERRGRSELFTFAREKSSMRRFFAGITGVMLAFTVAGCGDSEPAGPVPFKGTNPPGLDQQLDIMSNNMKNKAFTKPQETKPAEKKPADTKPAPKKE